MTESKTFASLSPSLLARKGSAKPAMRPQLQPMQQFHDQQFHEATARQLEEDLGWNDMGHDVPHPEPVHQEPAEVISIVAAVAAPVSAPVPEVVRQQESVAASVAEVAAPVRTASPAAQATRSRRSALNDGRRAAFTLRLDAERHLKLRLACTVSNRSAQQLVTDALDQLINNLPGLDSITAQVLKHQ